MSEIRIKSGIKGFVVEEVNSNRHADPRWYAMTSADQVIGLLEILLTEIESAMAQVEDVMQAEGSRDVE